MASTLLFALENTLVAEFRRMQSLMRLTLAERQALVDGDPQRLLEVIERKEALLDELGAISRARQAAQSELLKAGQSPNPAAVSLLEGVQVLLGRVRSLAQANSLLAAQALQHSASQQAGLLSEANLQLSALLSSVLASNESAAPLAAPFLERMSLLARQENALRAMLKVSNRTRAV